MNLLVPAALGLASLVVPLVVLYMLRSRRHRVEVGSTLLWERLEIPVSSSVPWQRLRITPLLLIQLLVLGLFVLALARPFFPQTTLLGPHTVLVIDTSGSMSHAGRFTGAIARANALVGDVSTANLVSIVEAGPTARVAGAFLQTPEAARGVIEGIKATGGAADLSNAIRLARGLATPDRPVSLIILSDGGSTTLVEEPVIGAVHQPLDATRDDYSLSGLTTQNTGGVERGFVVVGNHSASSVEIEIEVLVNGLPAGNISASVSGMFEKGQTFSLDGSPGDLVTVRIVSPPDANSLNDQAWMVLGGGPARKVELDGATSPFLEALVRSAAEYEVADEGEIRIVEGGDLGTIDTPVWAFATDPPPPGIELRELVKNVPVTFQSPGEPVLDSVDLSEVAVAQAQVVRARQWITLVRSGDIPLILMGEVSGYRVVYFTFDITHSNLPVQVGFPIMGLRLLDWLGGASGGVISSGVAGDSIPLAIPEGGSAEVVMPDGSERLLEYGVVAFRDTNTPGLYKVTYELADGTVVEGPVAIRNFDPRESADLPRTIETIRPQIAESGTQAVIREWAPWVVGVVLALMVLEWWVGHQRPVRKRRG